MSALFQPPLIKEIVNEIDHHLENPNFTDEFMEESDSWIRVLNSERIGILKRTDKLRYRLWMSMRNHSTFEVFNVKIFNLVFT